MNSDVLQGNWKQLRGELKKQWGQLTDDDLDRVAGSADQLAGILQEKYGLSRSEAGRDIDQFLSRYSEGNTMVQEAAEVKQDLSRTGRKMMSDMQDTAEAARPDVEEARQNLQHAAQKVVTGARESAATAAQNLQHTGQRAVSTARETVTQRPFMSTGVTLLLGLLLGLGVSLLLGTSRCKE
jgi:uncharacterized protein YjbJ (UPF0337 family)/ElaB/YqjD/DUF883 family membrane-anchored ribosome-binding protein